MVNLCVYIARANPLAHSLLFERFLPGRRASLPDIHIDVESARRLEVYRRIFDRFGSERVACAHGRHCRHVQRRPGSPRMDGARAGDCAAVGPLPVTDPATAQEC